MGTPAYVLMALPMAVLMVVLVSMVVVVPLGVRAHAER
jgi:hypothetical protein